MDASRPSDSTIRFADFEVNLCAGELRRSGARVHLQDQPFHVLWTLLQRPGEVVSREELRQQVWPAGTFVDFDHALNTAVKKIRCALGDDANIPRFVETIPRRGYRFIGQVNSLEKLATVEMSLLSDVECEASKTMPRDGRISRSVLMAAALVATVLAAMMLGRVSLHPMAKATAPIRRMTVVVFPFENLSRDQSEEFLSDGLSEELTTQLGRIDPDRLGVTARTTASNYRQTHASVLQVGKDLNADYFIEGSVRRDQHRLRVTAQLIRVSDQTHLWADDYDRPLDYTLTMQTEVATAIAREVSARLLRPVEQSSR